MTSKDGNHLIGGREADTPGLTNGPLGRTGLSEAGSHDGLIGVPEFHSFQTLSYASRVS
jgi:hypothetical protein